MSSPSHRPHSCTHVTTGAPHTVCCPVRTIPCSWRPARPRKRYPRHRPCTVCSRGPRSVCAPPLVARVLSTSPASGSLSTRAVTSHTPHPARTPDGAHRRGLCTSLRSGASALGGGAVVSGRVPAVVRGAPASAVGRPARCGGPPPHATAPTVRLVVANRHDQTRAPTIARQVGCVSGRASDLVGCPSGFPVGRLAAGEQADRLRRCRPGHVVCTPTICAPAVHLNVS